MGEGWLLPPSLTLPSSLFTAPVGSAFDMNDLIPAGAHRDVPDLRAGELGDALEVGARALGEVLPAAGFGGGGLPAGERLVDRLRLGEQAEVGREIVQRLAMHPIAGGDL